MWSCEVCKIRTLFSEIFFIVKKGLYFHFCPGVSLRKLIHSFLQKFFANSIPWPYPPEHSIARALRPENGPPDWKLPKKPEMESLQGERTVFYACLYKKGEEGAIHCWPSLFYSQLQQLPCTATQSCAPNHLTLSHSFCWHRTYLQNGLRQLITFDDNYSRHS